MKRIELKPVFVKTRNVDNFGVLMDALETARGEGRLGLVYGRAGRGKTRTAQWYAAHNRCGYLRVATIWRQNETDFLQALCRAVGIKTPPARKGRCFTDLVELLLHNPQPVFLDEIEKLHGAFLDVVRDLSDLSAAPFVLIGEEELLPVMQRNRRVWSRTYQQIEFEPIAVSDVMFYAADAAGLKFSPEVAGILHKSSGGDFRLVRRDMLSLIQFANAKKTTEITEEMARIAVKVGLKGE